MLTRTWSSQAPLIHTNCPRACKQQKNAPSAGPRARPSRCTYGRGSRALTEEGAAGSSAAGLRARGTEQGFGAPARSPRPEALQQAAGTGRPAGAVPRGFTATAPGA